MIQAISKELGISKGAVRTTLFIIFLIVVGLVIRYGFFTFVDSYELGYRYDKTTGKITQLTRTGWHRVTPFVTQINTVDTRPMQIRIEANNRVLNAMLVRFRSDGLQQFIDLHGRDDYDQAKLSEILKSYAYEGCGSNSYSHEILQKKYKFLAIMGNTAGTGIDSTVILKDSAR